MRLALNCEMRKFRESGRARYQSSKHNFDLLFPQLYEVKRIEGGLDKACDLYLIRCRVSLAPGKGKSRKTRRALCQRLPAVPSLTFNYIR